MHHRTKIFAQFVAVVVVSVVAPLTVSAQTQTFAGKYEGKAKSPDGEVALKLELTEDAGKYAGQVTSPHGVYKIVSANVADGLLTVEAEGNGTKGKLTLRQKGETLAGDFTADGRTGPVEFKKLAPVDNLSGDWDAVADAQGQPFPFSLTLKWDGEKITGSSSSQLGTSTISSGTWKDGKLAVMLDSGSGQIALVATMVDGKLSGDYDYAGQMSGKWVAIKKK